MQERLPEAFRLTEERETAIYGSDPLEIHEAKVTFQNFVTLCEQKERETSRPVQIIARFDDE